MPLRILISGAGVAGPTLAYWLVHHGFSATIVETAPRLRTGGYIVDFWGAGYDVAERMGMLPELEAAAYHVREVRFVNEHGRRVGGFPVAALDALTHGRFFSVPRSALAAAAYRAVEASVETLFGDEIARLEQDSHEVRVALASGGERTFDLVIGADGLHSNVRALAFDARADYELSLGYKVAAAEVAGYRPRDERVYVLYSPGRFQVGRFALTGDRTLFLFVWEDAERALPAAAMRRETLRARFRDAGWECGAMLDAIGDRDDIYLDRVSQIRMPEWSRGRVALVGDAAYCISLVGGQGTALAMLGAYVLAGELATAGGDHVAAFAAYEHRLAAFIARKQASAAKFARSFVPPTRWSAFWRDQATKLLRLPGAARLAFGRTLADELELPRYDGA